FLLMNKNSNFDFKAWYNQINLEKQRLESELGRIAKLTDILNSFVNEQESSQPQPEAVAIPISGEFEQLNTINKKIQLLYFLLDTVRALSAELDSDRRLSMITSKSAQLLNADRSMVFLIDPASKELQAQTHDLQENKTKFPRGFGIVGTAANSGRTLNISDTSKDANFKPEIDEKPAYNAKNLIVTPLRDTTGNIFGVLEVLNKNEGRFTPDDEYLFQAFATQAAMSIKNIAPGVGAPPLVSNPLLLIMKALSTGLGIDNLLQALMKKTTQVMNADRSTLFIVDYERHEVWSKVAEGTGISEIRFPLGMGIAGHVIDTGETVNIADAYQDRRFNQEIDARTGYHTNTVLCTALKDETNKVIGVKVVKSSQLVLNLLAILESERAFAK
ncbi:MAG: adenylate cyclase, partial [bacterium]